eukprot:scaffold9764_cov150-Isochrysis_galbana.AAC.1
MLVAASSAGYDLHSHFTYHTDDRHGHHPVLAVVVQLTADESSRHVAGAESEASTAAVAGEAHVVLCNSYHRSGRSTARTVLAVFFYKQKTRAVAQAQPPEKAVQPSEPKQEEAGSSKPEDARRKAVRRKMVRRKKKRKNLDVGTRTRRNLRQAVMMPLRE